MQSERTALVIEFRPKEGLSINRGAVTHILRRTLEEAIEKQGREAYGFLADCGITIREAEVVGEEPDGLLTMRVIPD